MTNARNLLAWLAIPVLIAGLWIGLGFILAGLWWLVTLGWGWWPL